MIIDDHFTPFIKSIMEYWPIPAYPLIVAFYPMFCGGIAYMGIKVPI